MLATGVGVAVVGTGTAVALAATSSTGPNLRVATVRVGSVDQTVDTSGTISSSLKLTPSFASSGTVASVNVSVGQHVSKGQVLAKLDTASLQADVDSANSTLASAKQQLQADETGQTGSSNNGTNNGASNIVAAAYVTYLVTPSTSISDLVKQVEDAQQAVITAQHNVDIAQPAIDAAQHTVDADVTQNTTLRNAQQQACATSSTPTPSASATSSSGNSDCADAMAAYEASADTLANDMATLDAKIAFQDGYVKQLDTSITTLDKLVDQLQSAAAHSGPGGGSTGPSSPSAPSTGSPSRPNRNGGGNTPNGSTPSGSVPGGPNHGGNGTSPGNGSSPSGQPNGNNGNNGNNNQPASAAQLAADQKAIDAAQAELKVAQQNLAAATLTSPAAGKVAAVGLTAGQDSSGGTITIVGTGIPGVQATVVLAQLDQVKVGESVTVAVDGVSTPLHGKVTSIGLLSTTSGSSTAYPVTVQLDAGTPQLYDGTGADIVISTGSAHNVLTVPNSAIHNLPGGRHTVTVVNGGMTSTVPVTLGIAGSDVTEVKSGLKAGQQVELADLSQQLPASTSNPNNGGFFGPGGFFPRNVTR
jgi:trimeric autotransporter adhesin